MKTDLMLKIIPIALLLVPGTWAASYRAAAPGGYWQFASTWGGAGVPGNGDTVVISDGAAVIVSDPRIVGTSGQPGTVAINTGNTGALVIANGGTLQVRGDIQYTSAYGANTSTYLTVQAGGTLEFDSSLNPAVAYVAHPDAAHGYRGFVTTGTAAVHAIVRSNAAGANGYFSTPVGGGVYVSTYTDFLRIGDAAHAAFQLWNTGDVPAVWDATHDTFTSCGLAPGSQASMAGTDIFRHDYNTHAGSLGASVFHRPGDAAGTQPVASGGMREIIGNVFDILADTGLDAMDFTIHSNYFAAQIGTQNQQTHAWRYFQNNFYREVDPATMVEMLVAMGDLRDNVFFLDDHSVSNVHGVDFSAGSASVDVGNIVDHAGQLTSSISSFVITNVALAHDATYLVKNNILLPNAAGHSSFWLSAPIQCCSNTGVSFVFDHNTVINDGGEALYTAHPTTEANPPGQLASFRDNILWNPSPGNGQSYKLYAAQNINVDVCAPENCDFNDGWNGLNASAAGFINSANGYADNFSSTPGQHDDAVTVDPMFVDPSRNTATFDSGYLGNHPAVWSDSANYTVGDMVSSADAVVYAGVIINYRYIDGSYHGATCMGANPKPGVYSDISHACWEWASLYRIREGVAAQTLYDDQNNGAHGVDIITALIQWIRCGFSPTNSTLSMAGHDGADIGAVPITFAAASYPATYPATHVGTSVMRGAKLRGGAIR